MPKLNPMERFLVGTKYLVLFGVFGTFLAAMVIYIVSALLSVRVTVQLVTTEPLAMLDPATIKASAVSFMRIVDLFLIAIAFQIISVGMYRLFINSDFPVPRTMDVRSFDELKRSLASIVIVVLLVLFLDYVLIGEKELALELGVAIAAVIFAASWAMKPTSSRLGDDESKSKRPGE